MGTWKSDGRSGKIFVGNEFEHNTRLPSMRWLREQVPMRELVQTLGLKHRGKYIHCWHPEKHDHGDRTPSVGIDVRRNKVHCFACGFDYSTLDLMMDVKQISVGAAAQWLASVWTSAGQVEQRYQVSERICDWHFREEAAGHQPPRACRQHHTWQGFLLSLGMLPFRRFRGG